MRVLFLFVLLLVWGCSPTAPQPLVECEPDQITAARAATGEYQPSTIGDFVRLTDGQLTVSGEPYPIYGINYYPARYPWRRFLTEADLDVVRDELTLIRAAGINTLRIFVWQYALFICPGSDRVPHSVHVQRLDQIIQTAATLDFRLIVTLNDLPDLDTYPLYDNPEYIQDQTRYIVERYRDERAILAWDVRNEGDIDYGTHPQIRGGFSKEQVLNWLDATTQFVRELDSNHLITAGWLYDAEATAPYVDFVSFHHWTGGDELTKRVETMRAATDKPILLEEFGYSTFESQTQGESIREVILYTQEADLLGWMIWTAFDFPTEDACYPSPCTSQDSREHHFGIWYSDYAEKPAVAIIRELTE